MKEAKRFARGLSGLPANYGKKLDIDPADTSNYCDFCKRRPPPGETVRMFTPGIWICDDPKCHEAARDDWRRFNAEMDRREAAGERIRAEFEKLCEQHNIEPYADVLRWHDFSQDFLNGSEEHLLKTVKKIIGGVLYGNSQIPQILKEYHEYSSQ